MGSEKREQNFSSQLSKSYELFNSYEPDLSYTFDSEYKEPFNVSEPDSYLIPACKEFITQLYQINRSSPARNSVLDSLLEYYLEWRNTKTYLVFREELIGPKLSIIEHYRAVLASKRGNEVYRWRLKNRIKDLKNLFPSTDLTNSAHSLSRSKILYLTLTYSGHDQMPIGESWDSRISKDFHRFTARLRRKYGRIAIIGASRLIKTATLIFTC